MSRRSRPGLTGMAWYGGPRPEPTGGLVASIGLNQDVSPRLAVDPDGVVPAPPARGRPRQGGPQLVVDPIAAPPDDSVTPVGRFRIPRG